LDRIVIIGSGDIYLFIGHELTRNGRVFSRITGKPFSIGRCRAEGFSWEGRFLAAG